MKFKKTLCFLFVFYGCLAATAQSIRPALLHSSWNASWITVPDESQTDYGVYIFRKILNLITKPDSLIIHVSADNRYKLFVNEKMVSLGPARGDVDHWNYETLDIAAFLKPGKNCISAMVWNEGEYRAEGQISLRTGFILQADDPASESLNTGDQWKCIRDNAYQPLKFEVPTYYVAGPGEKVDMNIQLSDWKKAEFDDQSWKNARSITPGIPKGLLGGYGTISNWLLIPSVIPQMELKYQRLLHMVRATGLKIPDGFPSAGIPVQIPSRQQVTILLDQGFLTNAYPELLFSGGKGATISLSYAEALFTKYPAKGNRNETEGKIFLGRKDSIISNGSRGQVFIPLSFRTYRYVQIRVVTGDDPVTIDDFFGTATGYPFQMNARLESDNPELGRMMEIGWRTARNCAMETYMDCPYYEQLQYIGDARIQALISLYNSGDERLLQNALNDMDNSRRPEGVTLSRHPSYTPQYIPTFSFWYIGMLHDYMMYGRDSAFLKNKLAGERQILQYFRNYQLPDGSLKGVPYWMFTDWVETKNWVSGAGPVGKDGCSALTDLQLLWAYQLAADLELKMGMPSYASLYNQYANQLKQTIRTKYFDEGRKLFADRTEKDLFSQHANALAILTGLIKDKEANATARLILTDTTLAPASIYFKFYLHQALVQAGLGNEYLSWLNQWRENIKMGLTTWAEIPDINNARSDCHAWGASPNIEFFRTLLGIDSDAPGFTVVRIEPHLGSLKYIKGEIPHPRGKIAAFYQQENGQWKILIELPPATTGNFIWREKVYPLKTGKNEFSFPR